SLVLEYREKMRRESMPVVLLEILFLKLSALLAAKGKVPVHGQEPEAAEKKEKIEETPGKKLSESETLWETSGEKTKKSAETEKPAGEKKEPAPAGEQEGEPDVASRWSEILAAVREKNRTVEACLREAHLKKVEGKTIYLSYNPRFSFHKGMVERSHNRKLVEQVIASLVGPGYRLEISTEGSQEKPLLEQESVKEVINFFQGEVVELEE
ncbi:MAG TPA: hypothetical protein PKX93_06885, partial [bacterium]|nr:hypothetical protein [bacterium]